MIEIIKLWISNSYTLVGLIFIPCFMLYKMFNSYLRYDDLIFLLVLFSIFIIIGFTQVLILVLNTKVFIYKDLAKLLIITKKIEYELESYGVEGKGMYEKAKNLNGMPHELLEEIHYIADIRNRAIHVDPKILNVKDVMYRANQVLKNVSVKKINYKLILLSVPLLIFSLFIGYQIHYMGGSVIMALVLYIAIKNFNFYYGANVAIFITILIWLLLIIYVYKALPTLFNDTYKIVQNVF